MSGGANATRTETIQFTYTNADLLYWGEQYFTGDPNYCEKAPPHGVAISSDLEIDQFIYDKATIAALAADIGKVPVTWPPFDTFQEQINFVISHGGSATPMWKFARVAVNPSGTFLSATRTNTDSLTITIGAVTPATSTQPAQLKSTAQSLHNEGVGGTLTGTQGRGTAPPSGD